jgi:hypothetical protein
VYFTGSQSLTGTGEIVSSYSGDKVYVRGIDSATPAALTVGSGVTLHGLGTVQAYYTGDSLVNEGTIRGDVSGATLTVSLPVTNHGTLATSGAGRLTVSSLQASDGTIQVGSSSSDTGILALGGTWSSTGSMAISGGTLNLGGTFTLSGEETYSYAAGTVNITGTLNNAGSTLSLGSNTGAWTLNGGTIQSGTVAGSDGTWLKLYSGTLDGVTLNTNTVLVTGGAPRVKNGLTLNGTLSVPYNSGCSLYFSGSQSLTGTGEVVVGWNTSAYVSGTSSTAPATLTVGSGVTIRGQGTLRGSYTGDNLVNDGTLRSDSSGTLTVSLPVTNHGTLLTSGSGSLTVSNLQTNSGTVQAGSVASDTGTLTLGGTWSNTGSLVVNGGALTLGGTWSSTGSQTVNGGKLNLGGTFATTGLGTTNYTAGTVNITGTLNNADSTLSLGSSTGAWTLNGGTIQGGTVAGSDGTWLKLYSGTLDGVTLNTNTVLVAGGAPRVRNGLTLNGTLSVPYNSGCSLYFSGSQSLTGTGEIVVGWNTSAFVAGTSSTAPATLTGPRGDPWFLHRR